MERLHAPNEFFRIRRLREGMRAWEELWRLLADGPHRLASREGDDAEAPYTAYFYLKGPLWPLSMLSRRMPLIGPNLLPSLPPMHSVAPRRWPSL